MHHYAVRTLAGCTQRSPVYIPVATFAAYLDCASAGQLLLSSNRPVVARIHAQEAYSSLLTVGQHRHCPLHNSLPCIRDAERSLLPSRSTSGPHPGPIRQEQRPRDNGRLPHALPQHPVALSSCPSQHPRLGTLLRATS